MRQIEDVSAMGEEHQLTRRDGVRAYVLLGIASAGLVGLLLAFFSAYAPLPQVFAAAGTVIWPENSIVMTAPTSGHIGDVFTDPGSEVHRGDRLLVVRSASGDADVKAPASGRVMWAIEPLPGAPVSAGGTLGVIVTPATQSGQKTRPPQRAVVAAIAPTRIGQIELGQTVRITLSGASLPSQKLEGRVARIAPPSIDAGAGFAGPSAGDDAFFVTVSLEGEANAMPLAGTPVTVHFEEEGGRLTGLIAPLFGAIGGGLQ